MKKLLAIFMIFCLVIVLAGCNKTAAIYTPISLIKVRATLPQVEEAILNAAQKFEWETSKIADGLIEAKYSARRHSVTILIKYSDTRYDISYKNSANLNYDPTQHTIHKNYNRWINNLNKQIMSNLY